MAIKNSTNNVMNDIATNIVMEKAIEHKTAEFEEKLIHSPENEVKIKEEKALDLGEENDDEIYKLREQRIQQLKMKQQRLKNLKNQLGENYEEFTEEEFANSINKFKLMVCHFYHDEFERCKIIDMHLQKLSAAHLETKFIKLNALKCPFFSYRLGIKTLPSLVFLIDGEIRHLSVGFEDVGGIDSFPTIKLERLMLRHKVVDPPLCENDDESSSEDGDF